MELKIIDFETAKLAKQKGFNELCLHVYNKEGELSEIDYDNFIDFYSNESNEKALNPNYQFKDCPTAPTQELLAKWLREEYKIIIVIDFYSDENKNLEYIFRISEPKTWDKCDILVGQDFKTHEEALEEGIIQALNLLDNYEE